MSYYRGVFFRNSQMVLYYLSCGIIKGGDLDVETSTVESAETVIWRHNNTIFILGSSLNTQINIADIKTIIDSEPSVIKEE